MVFEVIVFLSDERAGQKKEYRIYKSFTRRI